MLKLYYEAATRSTAATAEDPSGHEEDRASAKERAIAPCIPPKTSFAAKSVFSGAIQQLYAAQECSCVCSTAADAGTDGHTSSGVAFALFVRLRLQVACTTCKRVTT